MLPRVHGLTRVVVSLTSLIKFQTCVKSRTVIHHWLIALSCPPGLNVVYRWIYSSANACAGVNGVTYVITIEERIQ